MMFTTASYLPSSTLPTDHQGLVGWVQLTTNVPVGFLSHNEDVWLELLFKDTPGNWKDLSTDEESHHSSVRADCSLKGFSNMKVGNTDLVQN